MIVSVSLRLIGICGDYSDLINNQVHDLGFDVVSWQTDPHNPELRVEMQGDVPDEIVSAETSPIICLLKKSAIELGFSIYGFFLVHETGQTYPIVFSSDADRQARLEAEYVAEQAVIALQRLGKDQVPELESTILDILCRPSRPQTRKKSWAAYQNT